MAEYLAFDAAGGGLGHWPHCGAYHNGQRTVLATPVLTTMDGSLDRFAIRYDGSQIWLGGWADGDVHLYVDGVGYNLGTPDIARPDVPAGAAGFNRVVDVTAGPGSHYVCVFSVGERLPAVLGCQTLTATGEWLSAL